MAITMLFGGARSGKSALAVELGIRHGGPVTYIATATAIDDDMSARIIRHRQERPAEWNTIEEEVDLKAALAATADDSLAIVDCLTLWTSNVIWQEHTDEAVLQLAIESSRAASERTAGTVVISNEVGLGVHPETSLGRRYRDVLGRVNQCWAAAASQNLLLVAGQAIKLRDPLDLLLDATSESPKD